jgi:hypothetical protein
MDIDHLRALLSGERQEPSSYRHRLRPALVRVIRAANTHAVLLSRDTVVKQAIRHPGIGFDQYRLLPYVIHYGMVAQKTLTSSFGPRPSCAVLRHAGSHRVPTIALAHLIYILCLVNLPRRPVAISLG